MSTRRPLATPEEVSQHLGVPLATLYKWRVRRTGPRSIRVGRHLRYAWTDIERWLDGQSQTGGEAA